MKKKCNRRLRFTMLPVLMTMVFCMLSISTAFAQVKSVAGSVTDVNGEPIPGVNIVQKGTTNGVSTDFDGNYAITLKEGSKVLLFSYIGFDTQEITVNTSNINVTLEEDTQALEEVVVIGYAPVERKKVLGSIASVKAESIVQASPVQAFDAVQGKLAGVQILSNNGPGQGFDIRIRGVSTFGSGTSPLYVVDGQQLDDIDNIDPNDIASLEVLKDGATAAIYGSKAANGVVLITTKSGKSGDLKIEVSQTTGFNSLVGDLPVVNTEERFLLEKKRAGNLETLPRLERDSLSLLRRNDYDLQSMLTRPAVRTQTNFSISGGSDKVRFLWNTGYLYEEGVVINSDYKRINTQLKLDANVSKKFKLGTRLALTNQDKSGLTEGGIFTHLVERLPYLPLYEPNGSYTPTIGGRKNPLAFANLQVRDDRDFRIQVFNYAQLEVLPKLTIKSTLGVNWRFRKQDQFDTKLIANRIETGNDQARLLQDMTYDIQQENFLNYKNRWGDHDLGAFGGMQIQKYFIEYTDFRSRILNNSYVQTLNNASPGSITGDNNANERHNLFSLFAGFNYDFADKYLIGGTIRRDGSSRFGDENEYGVFPSATLGWRISNENFLKDSELINNLLVRGSWGVTGNERIGNYNFTEVLVAGQSYNGNSGIGPQSSLANPELSWEETESTNLGLDLSILKNRVDINLDLWQKKTTGLLATTPLPEESGYSGILRNVGAVDNRGIDFSITGTIIDSKDFTWSSNFNIGFLENEVTKLDGGTEFYPGGRYLVREGEPIGNIYGYKNQGVYQYTESNAYTDDGTRLTPNFDGDGNFTNYTLNGAEYTDTVNKIKVNGRTPEGGDIIWEDLDGDFNITADDRQILGNGLATTYGGFSHDLRYKNLSVSLLFDFSLNHDIYSRWDEDRNDLAAGAESPGPERVYGAWFEPGDETIYPRLDRVPQNRLKPNSFFVSDGSFIKWRYIRFNYIFDQKVIDKIPGVKGASMNFAVNNLITWTNYKGYNPELGNRGSALTPNMDQLRYPNDREIILGVKFQF
ncbi:TonB-dependent receptor [Maribacter sp. TH_r10]|uniref:SusC/RagA family TonB-linked outer membrane protein n=1 Tax=Maribacter luteus TaxID=2594478 RepID=A0A6I2MLQ7_9FLAO|nr:MULTISPECIES: TonB-dependent receptor [Maribacter]MDV7140377.1 TonB-dependent receptor [Maribacter sp. TH_r10]MRX64741.1 SusC/RagA family TonB-linked outer membrane protein [Maribacter luteus]